MEKKPKHDPKIPAELKPSSELVKELFAFYGAAYYHSECLHRELSHLYVAYSLPSSGATRPRVEELLSAAYSRTFGQLAKDAENYIPLESQDSVQEALRARNFLAHHFWYERAHLMTTGSGVSEMIFELRKASRLFEEVDAALSPVTHARWRSLGIPNDAFEKATAEMEAGREMEPLPTKRKLRKQERILQAWTREMPDDRRPIYFETNDGEFWQLCDVGLGWADQVNRAELVVERRITDCLPAEIDPRPQISVPWSYEFTLARGATFWVRPGQDGQTHRWGVRCSQGQQPASKLRQESAHVSL